MAARSAERRTDEAEVPARTPRTSVPCPVCGYPIRSDESYEVYDCVRCGVLLHGPCYWGRIAALEEWLTYLRRVMETEDDDFEADVVCAVCRQLKGGLGK
jgi:ribosomal protein L37AE/L43A